MKYIWIAAFVILLLAAVWSPAHAARTSRRKLQIIYQTNGTGAWQVFVFGLPGCDHPAVLKTSTDATQPIEIVCK